MSEELVKVNGRTICRNLLRAFPGLGSRWVVKGRKTDEDPYEPVAHCLSKSEADELIAIIRYSDTDSITITAQNRVVAASAAKGAM